jgi:FkbM family methyltransferase
MFKYLKERIKERKKLKKLSKLPLVEREFFLLKEKYLSFPRYKEENVEFLNYKFKIPDCTSFVYQFGDIFVNEVYKFNNNADSPVIIDCGANIGMSCLYFAQNYPNAKIYAFEADNTIFQILSYNLSNNNIKNVKLFNTAVWINNEDIVFNSEGADAGSIVNDFKNKQRVKAIRLKEFIEKEEEIDFLKLDVEGAETEIIIDCNEVLKKVKNLFIEYHSILDKPQSLHKILEVLTNSGFRYHMENNSNQSIPFIKRIIYNNMDLQINIFAYKEY